MKIRSLVTYSFTISLLIHISSIVILKVINGNTSLSEPREKVVEVTFIDANKIELLSKQIVEQDEKPVNDEVDPHAKYLSQFNQKVVKQTRAEKSGKFNNQAGQGLGSGSKQKLQQASISARPQDHGKESFNLDKFKPKVDWASLAQQNQSGNNREVSATSDHLKDLEKGLQTNLSTREFLYYTYFKRIKNQIQNYWEPNIKKKISKIMQSGRKIASIDRVTKLVIVLDNNGQLQKIQVLHDSGVQDLDDAAIEAFKSAAPFPNPPSGLVEDDGTVKIRWDFVLEA